MKVGVFPMVADLLHVGHLRAIEKAHQHCDRLIIALNVDPTVDNPNKNKPIESVYERWCRLKSNKLVDEIIPYCGEKDLELLLKTTDYNVRFIGSDHRDYWTGKEYEASCKIKPIVLEREHDCSSTNLRKRIKESE